MTEFTQEQEIEIQKRIAEAQAAEQWKIAGDQFYRDAIVSIAGKVQAGMYDPYILNVGQALHDAFRKANFTQTQQEQPDEDKQD